MTERFRPRHIVAMVVAVSTAVVLMPVAVGAATGSLVNIVDPSNAANKAKVSNMGQLYVTETDPYNGAFGRIGTNGSRLVSMAAPSTPWNQINDIQVTGASPRAVLYTGLGPARLNFTSFTFSAEGSTAGTVRAFVIVYVSDTSSGNCLTLTGASFGAAERFVLTVPVGQTVNVVYPTPLVYSAYASAGRRFCIDVEGSGPSGYVGHIHASGFVS